MDAIRAEEEDEDVGADESDSLQVSDQSIIQIEMEEQDKAGNLEPVEISEVENGAVENGEELTDNESDEGTDDVSKVGLWRK